MPAELIRKEPPMAAWGRCVSLRAPALTQHVDSLTSGLGVGGQIYFLYTRLREKKKKPAQSTVLRWESQALARLELSGEQA